MREVLTTIACGLAGILLMGSVYLFLFTAPSGLLWLAGILFVFAVGIMFGRSTVRR